MRTVRVAVFLLITLCARAQEPSSEVHAILTQIVSLQNQLMEARKRFTDSHPMVIQMLARLNELEARLRVGAPPDPIADTWWRQPATVQNVGISAEQQKTIDRVFQSHRATLAGLMRELEKAESALGPLMNAAMPDEGKIRDQIDKVAEARAALEKEKGRMLLEIRLQLKPDQWEKLSQPAYHEPAR